MPLDWFPEPFQAYGSFAGDGARRVLGKPELDPLTVLIRETGQNAWDARNDDSAGITFGISGWNVTTEQRSTLEGELFARRPPLGIDLDAVIREPELAILCISDRGTKGLSGPTRADRAHAGPSDFVDYVFNMGQPRDVAGGGGTYGFGKTITYVISRAATVVVHTRTRTPQGPESRLIGIAVGGQYEEDGDRFTGRHWWGVNEGSVQPVRGPEADTLARRLGMPGFDIGTTGTDIAIIGPDLGGRSPHAALRYLVDATLWHFWPKMLARDGGLAPMQISFAWDSRPLEVPTVDRYPPLHGYARAFRALERFQEGLPFPDDVFVTPVQGQRPRRRLGSLAIVRFPRLARRPVNVGSEGSDDEYSSPAAFTGNSHHVALMRQVHLVVAYRPGPELPVPDIEWCGVFVNEPDIEPAFAEAEPPTHDDWQPAMVADKIQRRLVKATLASIDAEVRLQFGGARPSPEPGAAPSPVVVADALGGLIASTPGIGPAKQERADGSVERKSAQAPRKPTIVQLGSRLLIFRGERATEARFRVNAPYARRVRLSADVAIVIDGGRLEREAPLGSDRPSILGWARADMVGSERLIPGAEIIAEARQHEVWSVLVRTPPAVALAINVRCSDAS